MRVRKIASATAVIAGAAAAAIGMPAVASAQTAPIAANPNATHGVHESGTIPHTACSTKVRVCLSLAQNKAWLVKNGKISYGPAPISSGKPGQETPPGFFHVQWKDIDHRSHEYNNAPMPYSTFFNGGIAFHEGSIHELSNGCVHMTMKDAATFYNQLKVGDLVQVTPERK